MAANIGAGIWMKLIEKTKAVSKTAEDCSQKPTFNSKTTNRLPWISLLWVGKTKPHQRRDRYRQKEDNFNASSS